MLDGAAGEAVAPPAEFAVFPHQHLRHQKQGDALRAGRGVRQFGQHQMDDVLGEVMLARGDEDLRAGDAVTAVPLRLGAGADDAQVGSGMRLGEAHAAAPLSGIQFRQIGALHLGAAVPAQGEGGAGGEDAVKREGRVGPEQYLLDKGRQHLRHPLPAVFLLTDEALPAPLGEGGEGLRKALGGGDRAVGEAAGLRVPALIEGGQQVTGDFAGLGENRRGEVGADLGGAGHGGEQLLGGEHILQQEVHIGERGLIGGHWCLLLCVLVRLSLFGRCRFPFKRCRTMMTILHYIYTCDT